MKLVSQETTVFDYNKGEEKSDYNVVAEKKGWGTIPYLVDFFRKSKYKAVRVIPNENEEQSTGQLAANFNSDLRRRGRTGCFAMTEAGKVFLIKF